MSPPRILSDKQERDVAIAYLCCAGHDYFRAKWNIAAITVANTILNVRSVDWEDPLLEFYRSRGRSIPNFAHFYLAYRGENVERKELVEPARDGDIYQALCSDIVKPFVEKIAADTGLDCYVEPHTGIEVLLNDIFGTRTAEKVLTTRFAEMLYLRYLKFEASRKAPSPKPYYPAFTLGQLTKELRHQVVIAVKHGGLGITPSKNRILERVLGTIPRRDALVLRLYYGIHGHGTFTLDNIGSLLGLTRERVRQIKEKAILRLKQPARSQELMPIYELSADETSAGIPLLH